MQSKRNAPSAMVARQSLKDEELVSHLITPNPIGTNVFQLILKLIIYTSSIHVVNLFHFKPLDR